MSNEAQFKIKISSQVEIRALREMEASLSKQIVQARTLGKDYSDLERQLGQVQGRLSGFSTGSKLGAEALGFAEKIPVLGEGIRALNGAVGSLGAVAAVASVALAGASKAVTEFAQAEQAVAKLDAAMAQFGILTDANRRIFQELAGELQATTGIADDRWIAILAKLVQFGSNPASIGMDAEAVKNLAGIVGDVETAAGLYSKALAGNFEMLGRYGIKVDEAATKTEKLAQLQEIAAQRGGGQLEAQTKTLIGSFAQLKNNVSDLWEGFGLLISKTGVLQWGLNGLSTATRWWADLIGDVFPAVEGLKNKLENLGTSLGAAEQANKDFAESQKKIKDASEANKDALQQELTELGKRQRALDQLTDAEMAHKLALLDLEKAQRGPNMSEVEFTAREAAIRKKAAAQKFQNDQNRIAGQLAANQKPVTAARQDAEAATADLIEQQRLVEAAQARAARNAAITKQGESKTRLNLARRALEEMGIDPDDALKIAGGQKSPETKFWSFNPNDNQIAQAKKAAQEFSDAQRAARGADQDADTASAAYSRTRATTNRNPGTVAAESAKYDNLVKLVAELQARYGALLKKKDIEDRQLGDERNLGRTIYDKTTQTTGIKSEADKIKADQKDDEAARKEAERKGRATDKDIRDDFKGRKASTDFTPVNAATEAVDDSAERIVASFVDLSGRLVKKFDDLSSRMDDLNLS